MAALSNNDRTKLETIFLMSSGYVLDFTNQSFERFIRNSVKLEINSHRFEKYGTSKAKRLLALWDIEGNVTVGKLTEEMLEYLRTKSKLDGSTSSPSNKELFEECVKIAHRLQGKKVSVAEENETVEDFLKKDLDEIELSNLKFDKNVTEILENRISEAKRCLNGKSPLAVIFLCGSILEGVLLSLALSSPKEFNQSLKSPQDKQTLKVKPFHEWSLSSFIEVAYDLGYLSLNIKKFGHSLRDFRNYIHPFEQMTSGFTPDFHTAKISWQVLKAALHDIHEKVK